MDLVFLWSALSIALAVGVASLLVALATRLARQAVPSAPGERLAALEWLKAEAEARRKPGTAAGHDDVVAALDALRREVAELAERMDFAERLLAKQGEPERLLPPQA